MTSTPSIFGSLTEDAIYASDSLSVMMEQEHQSYFSTDYLPSANEHSDDDLAVTDSDRTEIVLWLYSVIDHCQFDHETVVIAMGLVDRFLSRGKNSKIAKQAPRDDRLYQLISMRCPLHCHKTQRTRHF